MFKEEVWYIEDLPRGEEEEGIEGALREVLLDVGKGGLEGHWEWRRWMLGLEQGADGDEKETVRKPDGRAVGRVVFCAGELVGERPEVLVGEAVAEKYGVGLKFNGDP